MDFRWLHDFRPGETVSVRPWSGRLPAAPDGVTADPSVRVACVLDTETTGLETADQIIEIALRSIAYDSATGEVLGLVDAYDGLQDPVWPLSDEVQRLTGLTDADLAGQTIDWGRVAATIGRAQLVIAHNAKFDRPRVDAALRAYGECPQRAWACSREQIDWRAHGLPASALGALCMAHGFYGVAHRAGGDAAALAHLLGLTNGETGRTYLAELLEDARRPMVRVVVYQSPYTIKDALKRRGYRWSPESKSWAREIPRNDLVLEKQWAKDLSAFVRCEDVDPMARWA